MIKYVHKIEDFEELFVKLAYQMENLGATYTAMLFEIKDESRISEFENFLLKYIRISDTVFHYSENKVLLLLEETTLRGAILLDEKLREKIKEKGFKYDFFNSAVQGDFIETEKKLIKALKKRLKKAKEDKAKECIYSLSYTD